MKTKEELNASKKQAETPNGKFIELDEEELEQVTGGGKIGGCALVDGNGAFDEC